LGLNCWQISQNLQLFGNLLALLRFGQPTPNRKERYKMMVVAFFANYLQVKNPALQPSASNSHLIVSFFKKLLSPKPPIRAYF